MKNTKSTNNITSNELVFPENFDPFKAIPKKPEVKRVTENRVTIGQALSQVAANYAVLREEHARDEAKAEEMWAKMNDPKNPYDKVDYKSPFKKEKELQQPQQQQTVQPNQAKQPIQPKGPVGTDGKDTTPTQQQTHHQKKDDEKEPDKTKKKHYISSAPFKDLAGKMGEDLYALSDWEYNYTTIKSNIKPGESLPDPRSDVEPVSSNRILRRAIQNLGTEMNLTHEIRDFLSQNRESFWHGGSIHAVIFNDKTGQLFYFVADPGDEFSTLASGGFISVEKRRPHGLDDRNLTREQDRILDELKYLGDQYVKYGRRTLDSNYEHGYTEAVELRRRILNMLGLGEGYTPPLDRDPQDVEAERAHKAKKAAKDRKR
jgi:hypothetical protein